MSRIKRIFGTSSYYVTSDGRVLCSRPSRNQFGETGWKRFWKKQRLQNSGYKIVDIIFDGKQKTRTVHRLVAIHFINEPSSGNEVNHIDGIKSNNSVDNLEWCSASENSKHAWDNKLRKVTSRMVENARALGKKPKTEMMKSKLSERRVSISKDKAIEIREFYLSSKLSMKIVADKYSVSISTVQKCVNNTFKCWNLIGEKI